MVVYTISWYGGWLERRVRNGDRRFMVNKATCATDCNGCSSLEVVAFKRCGACNNTDNNIL